MDINGMKITDVVVYPISKKGRGKDSKLFAFAKVVLNDQFIVHGIRIYEGAFGPFMTFPQDLNVKDKTMVYPRTAQLRSYISEQVIAEYELSVNRSEVA